jgi:DNA modification methylase
LIDKFQELDWTFRGVKAREGIHGLHLYPAMMAPPIARRLIGELTNRGDIVLDPFCGSGTVLAEAVLLGRETIGYDINPLALLVAKVKTTPIHPDELKKALESIERIASVIIPEYADMPEFTNMGFWFKPEVIADLSRLKNALDHLQDEDVNRFFKLVFARTVRQVSNTKGNEFKLVRIPEEKLRLFKPNVFVLFKMNALKCIGIMEQLYLNTKSITPHVEIHYHDSRHRLPLDRNVDLMLTSPPYGDSRTTVAYGQFSRLALQWLGMWEKNVDLESLGGKPTEYKSVLPTLQQVISKIREIDKKRAKDVESFYFDLQRCVENIARVIKLNGYAVFVIANRKVKGVILPNDRIIVDMMMPLGFSHIGTLNREIPNKRMPSRNSPSNIPGETDVTMLNEQIALFIKDKVGE